MSFHTSSQCVFVQSLGIKFGKKLYWARVTYRLRYAWEYFRLLCLILIEQLLISDRLGCGNTVTETGKIRTRQNQNQL